VGNHFGQLLPQFFVEFKALEPPTQIELTSQPKKYGMRLAGKLVLPGGQPLAVKMIHGKLIMSPSSANRNDFSNINQFQYLSLVGRPVGWLVGWLVADFWPLILAACATVEALFCFCGAEGGRGQCDYAGRN